jgi:RNA polymerase sigma-70 factor (ECF subfamily)
MQQTLLRALRSAHRFTAGTNLKAWLFMIARNEYFSQLRRRKFEAFESLSDGLTEPSVPADHDGALELRELRHALTYLPAAQRTALLLVSVNDISYEEAAAMCRCAVGTIKSRVSRARSALLAMLERSASRTTIVDSH